MNIDNYISSGIIELYVLGLCSAEEKIEIEQLRLEHISLNSAIIDFEIAFENKMLDTNLIPTQETNNGFLNFLQTQQKKEETPIIVLDTKAPPKNNLTFWKSIAASAILLLGISAAFNYSLFSKNKKQGETLATIEKIEKSLPLADFKIMKDPNITPIAMNGVGYHAVCKCTMYWDKKTGKAYILVQHLQKSDDAKDFQLWAMVNNKPVSIGIINDKIRDRFIEMPGMPADAKSFNVTLEKAGGSETPTLEELYLTGSI